MFDLSTFTADAAAYFAAAPTRTEMVILCGTAFLVLKRHDSRIATVNRRLTRFLSLMSGAVQPEGRRPDLSGGGELPSGSVQPAIDIREPRPLIVEPAMPNAAAVTPNLMAPQPVVDPDVAFPDEERTTTVAASPSPDTWTVDLAQFVIDVDPRARAPEAAPIMCDNEASALALIVDETEIANPLDASEAQFDATLLVVAASDPVAADPEPTCMLAADDVLDEPQSFVEAELPSELASALQDGAPSSNLAVDEESEAEQLAEMLSASLGTTQAANDYAEAYQASLHARIEHEQRLQTLLESRTASLAKLTNQGRRNAPPNRSFEEHAEPVAMAV